jgi:hypothetical protein
MGARRLFLSDAAVAAVAATLSCDLVIQVAHFDGTGGTRSRGGWPRRVSAPLSTTPCPCTGSPSTATPRVPSPRPSGRLRRCSLLPYCPDWTRPPRSGLRRLSGTVSPHECTLTPGPKLLPPGSGRHRRGLCSGDSESGAEHG